MAKDNIGENLASAIVGSIEKLNSSLTSELDLANQFLDAMSSMSMSQVVIDTKIHDVDDAKKDLKSLGSELQSVAESNSNIVEQLGLRQTIGNQLIAIQENEIENNEALISSTENLTDKLNTAIERQEKARAELEKYSSNTIFADWRNSLGGLQKDLNILRKDFKIAGTVFAGVVTKSMMDGVGTMENLRKETGMSADQMFELSGATLEASISSFALGVGFGDAAEAAGAIYMSSHNLKDATGAAVSKVAELNSMYGVAADTGAELLGTFQDVNKGSEQAALNTFDFAESTARAAGIPIGKLMNDVASNTELFAKYGSDGGKNLIKAAGSAAKLGLSLSEVGSISSSLLNVDSSIQAEMEASVLIGKQLNLNRARELALAGDMDGMMKEVLDNVVSVNEWEGLNVIQREALSESLGLDVNQMQAMVANQKEINRLEDTHQSTLDKTWMYAKGIGTSVMNYKEELASGVNFALSTMTAFPKMGEKVSGALGSVFTTMGDKFKMVGTKAKGLFSSIGKGATDVVSKGADKFGALTKKATESSAAFSKGAAAKGMGGKLASKVGGNPIVNWINSWSTMNPQALLNFSLATGVMLISMVGLAFALKQFSDVPWESAVKGMGSLFVLAMSMKMIGNLQGDILKGSIAMGIMSLSIIPLAYALNMFNTIEWESLAKGGVALLGLTASVMGLGALLSSGIGAVVFGAGIIGFIALGGALTVLGIGLMSISSGMSDFVPMMTELAAISPNLLSLGGAFASMGAGLVTMSLGLLAVAPFLPVLAALKSIGGISSQETSTSSTESKSSTDVIAEKLDVLIALMSNQEMSLNIDGRKFGTILGKKNNQQRVFGI